MSQAKRPLSLGTLFDLRPDFCCPSLRFSKSNHRQRKRCLGPALKLPKRGIFQFRSISAPVFLCRFDMIELVFADKKPQIH